MLLVDTNVLVDVLEDDPAPCNLPCKNVAFPLLNRPRHFIYRPMGISHA